MMKKLDNYLEEGDNEFLVIEDTFEDAINSRNEDFIEI